MQKSANITAYETRRRADVALDVQPLMRPHATFNDAPDHAGAKTARLPAVGAQGHEQGRLVGSVVGRSNVGVAPRPPCVGLITKHLQIRRFVVIDTYEDYSIIT